MKSLKWIVGICTLLMAVVLMLVMALSPMVDERQASFEPVTRETLKTLGIPALDEEGLTGTSHASGESSESESPENEGSIDELDSDTESEALSRLAQHRGANNLSQQRYSSILDRGFTRVYLAGLKRYESSAWLAGRDSAGGLLLEIGYESFRMGDFEEAKMYLYEALRVEKREFWRNNICGMLALLEEDAEIAAALLREVD